MPSTQSSRPTLVAGYDGTEGAAAAVRWAARRAAPGGRVIVVCADHPGSPRPLTAARRERAQAGLKALWMEEDVLVDTDVQLVLDDAAPADALCRVARETGADAIVVGRHHGGRLDADTVHHLLAVADRPVTVIPE